MHDPPSVVRQRPLPLPPEKLMALSTLADLSTTEEYPQHETPPGTGAPESGLERPLLLWPGRLSPKPARPGPFFHALRRIIARTGDESGREWLPAGTMFDDASER